MFTTRNYQKTGDLLEVAGLSKVISKKRLSKSCMTIEGKDNNGNIKTITVLYNTRIVEVKEDKIKLNSGGYYSNTTKSRINQVINPLNFRLIQRDYEWYVITPDNKKVEYVDGMELKLK